MNKEWKLKIAKTLFAVMILLLAFLGSKEIMAESISDTEELMREKVLKKGTVDDAEMTGKVGYFTVNIDGDQQTSMKIKVNYSSLDESKTQKVILTPVSKETNNNHNLKIKNDSVAVFTQQGSTKIVEKAQDDGKGGYVTGRNDSGELIYKTKNYVIFEVTFTYNKDPYTYAVGEQVKSVGAERFNTKLYTWQNTGDSTLSKKIYHQSNTEEFTMQVNIANTGIYDAGSGTVEGIYTVHLKHPTLSVNFKGNGATSGKEGTQTYTYNESKDLWNVNGSTLGFARTNYTKVAGAEWNTRADGTGTSYNQDTAYAATALADFTDGKEWTSKSMTLYAQWKSRPASYGIYLHPNSPTGTVASWWRSGKWCHDNVNWKDGMSADGTADTNLSNSNYMYKQYEVGKTYSLPAASGNLSVDGYICTDAGWYTSPDGGDYIVNGADGKVSGTALADYVGSDGAVHLYAHWQPNIAGYTVKHWKQKLAGTAGVHDGNNYDLAETENLSEQIGSSVTPPVKSYTGFSSPEVQSGTVAADGSLVINYYYDRQFYDVMLYAGAGIESVFGGGSYLYGSTVNISAEIKEGYHWLNWTGTFNYSDVNAVFTMPAQNVELTANGETNTYIIHFDPNCGTGHIDDIVTTYDTDVTLPDGTAAYKKYTRDGVNVTSDVGSGAISEEETKQAEGIADKTVYPSVFLGWALYEHKDDLQPQWKAGDVVKNLTTDYNGEVTLYAVWDDCPWIEAYDLYYSLEQAQSGFITIEEILNHASAVDREDGSPILPGTNPAVNHPAVNTSFTIPDYQATEFTSMTHDAAVSENLTVVDSSGSTYRKQIMVYVVDTIPVEIKPKGITRFINEKYFKSSFENGGLEDNSIWKTNPEYKSVLQSAFDNLKNGTPERVYTFTHQQILEMKEFIRENGVSSTETPEGLQRFYDKFMKKTE